MWETWKGFGTKRERYEAWEGIHEGTLRLDWWLETKVWTLWRVKLKTSKRSLGKAQWLETKDENRSDVTEDRVWEWKSQDENSRRVLT